MTDLGVLTLVYAIAAVVSFLAGREYEKRRQRDARMTAPYYTGTAVDVARFMSDQVTRHGGDETLLFTIRTVEVGDT